MLNIGEIGSRNEASWTKRTMHAETTRPVPFRFRLRSTRRDQLSRNPLKTKNVKRTYGTDLPEQGNPFSFSPPSVRSTVRRRHPVKPESVVPDPCGTQAARLCLKGAPTAVFGVDPPIVGGPKRRFVASPPLRRPQWHKRSFTPNLPPSWGSS